jgi:hypothetical protein
MDPITASIVATLAAGVLSGTARISENLVYNAYQSLRNLLEKKHGSESDLLKAIRNLESKPESVGRRTTLQEEIVSTKSDQDPEIVQAAQALLDHLNESSDKRIQGQIAEGSFIAQADHGSSASVNINRLKDDSQNNTPDRKSP